MWDEKKRREIINLSHVSWKKKKRNNKLVSCELKEKKREIINLSHVSWKKRNNAFLSLHDKMSNIAHICFFQLTWDKFIISHIIIFSFSSHETSLFFLILLYFLSAHMRQVYYFSYYYFFLSCKLKKANKEITCRVMTFQRSLAKEVSLS
jgi:hypothetical protein